MQVLQINRKAFSKNVSLIASGGKIFVLPLDYVVKNNLKIGDSVSDSVLEKESLEFQLKEFALSQIAISAKNKFLLKTKLLQKLKKIQQSYKYDTSPSADFFDNLLNQLESQNLISNSQFANSIVKKYSKKSNFQIKQKLLSKGISISEIKKTLENRDPQEEKLAYQKLLQKLKLKYNSLPPRLQKIKINQSLYQKGFSGFLGKTEFDD